MAENENEVPIKEQEDGSILAKVELPEEIEVEGEETEGKKKKKDEEKNEAKRLEKLKKK